MHITIALDEPRLQRAFAQVSLSNRGMSCCPHSECVFVDHEMRGVRRVHGAECLVLDAYVEEGRGDHLRVEGEVLGPHDGLHDLEVREPPQISADPLHVLVHQVIVHHGRVDRVRVLEEVDSC